MVYLKEYYEVVRNPKMEGKTKEILENYGNKLKTEGWKYNMYEGAYISPDGSATFVLYRSPYQGRLLQFNSDRDVEFEECKSKMLENGDFIEIVK